MPMPDMGSMQEYTQYSVLLAAKAKVRLPSFACGACIGYCMSVAVMCIIHQHCKMAAPMLAKQGRWDLFTHLGRVMAGLSFD